MDEGRNEGSMLRGQIRVAIDDYKRKFAEWMDERKPGPAGEAGLKEFQARHTALKSALGHIELLVKLAQAVESGAAPQEIEADWEAEAQRNLARPA